MFSLTLLIIKYCVVWGGVLDKLKLISEINYSLTRCTFSKLCYQLCSLDYVQLIMQFKKKVLKVSVKALRTFKVFFTKSKTNALVN